VFWLQFPACDGQVAHSYSDGRCSHQWRSMQMSFRLWRRSSGQRKGTRASFQVDRQVPIAYPAVVLCMICPVDKWQLQRADRGWRTCFKPALTACTVFQNFAAGRLLFPCSILCLVWWLEVQMPQYNCCMQERCRSITAACRNTGRHA